MSPLILQLQQDVLNSNVSVSALLRKALLVSCRLKITDMETFFERELNGYKSTSNDYRLVCGRVMAFNRYHGWVPIIFPDDETNKVFAERYNTQSVKELESLLENSDGNRFQMRYSSNVEEKLRGATNSDDTFSLHIDGSVIYGILDKVRTMILYWVSKMEVEGIFGESDGISFSEKEK